MRLGIAVFCSIVLSQAASAAVLHVPADYATISLAIASAQSGDEVLVAAGTYHERISLDATKDGVKVHSESGAALTTIDGGNTGVVVTMTSVGSGTELTGFTIRGGNPAPPTYPTGGGIRLISASPKIENNVVTGNSAFAAAGIYAEGGSPLIENNEITGNQALGGDGGGIQLIGGTPDLENNFIHGNSASGQRGGGISVDGSLASKALIRGNRIISNTSEEGGGIFQIDGYADIQGNEIRSNTATNFGGGFMGGYGATLENNTIIANVAVEQGGGLYLGANPTLHGDLIQDNTAHQEGGGVFMNLGGPTFDHEVILRNHSGLQGGGISDLGANLIIKNSTIALNSATMGAGNVHLRSQANLTLQNSIVAFSPGGGVVADPSVGAVGFVWITCSDVSNNAGGDYVGLPAPPSDNRDLSLDPLFCDLTSLDVHLGSSSPCAAPNGCLQMGALAVSCQAVATEPSTWGRLKARYR